MPGINQQTKSYGAKLRKLRISRGVSQLELEAMADLSVGSVSRVENNRINPTKETLFRIAAVLNLSADETADLLCIQENLIICAGIQCMNIL